MSVQRPFSGVKPTSRRKAATSVFDPKRTWRSTVVTSVCPPPLPRVDPEKVLAPLSGSNLPSELARGERGLSVRGRAVCPLWVSEGLSPNRLRYSRWCGL